MSKPIIIIGSGLAGYNLVREIRQHDARVELIMITQDSGAFYSKPMLSTALSLRKTHEMLINMPAEKMSTQYNLQIMIHTYVEKIVPEDNYLVINHRIIEYSSLILCVGASTQLPTLNGDARSTILRVNDIDQYKIFRENIAGKKSITLLGAGLVGCEFANDLTQAGYNVHIVDPMHSPISALLPPRVGHELQQALTQQGADWHLGHTVQAINYDQNQYQVTLEDNTTWMSDIVFSAIGLKPRIELAEQANLKTHRGIIVDRFLTTSHPNIYALGDCAEINRWILPYVAPIMQASKALAKTLTGQTTALSLPAMAVTIKTSCYPLAVCRPPFATIDSTWEFETRADTLRGYLKDKNQILQGFILTKDAIKERMQLVATLEKWL